MKVHPDTAGSPAADTQDTQLDSVQATDAGAGDANESSDANSADSSAADTQDANNDGPKSLLDAVRGAVQSTRTEGNSSTPEAEEGNQKTDDAAVDTAKAGDDKSDDVPFHNHPRWQELQQDLKKFRGPAEQYAQIESFMNENHLTADEAVRGFTIMAMIKKDPAKALGELTKIVTNLELATGKRLPDDLRAKVDAGLVDEETATELAVTRNTATSSASALQARTERDHEQDRAATQASMRDSVNAWEREIRAKDADYSVKQPMVETRIRAIVQETGKAPSNVDEAVALAQQAYKDVNETLKQFAPVRRPMSQLRSTASAAGARPEPKSLGEAVRMAVGR